LTQYAPGKRVMVIPSARNLQTASSTGESREGGRPWRRPGKVEVGDDRRPTLVVRYPVRVRENDQTTHLGPALHLACQTRFRSSSGVAPPGPSSPAGRALTDASKKWDDGRRAFCYDCRIDQHRKGGRKMMTDQASGPAAGDRRAVSAFLSKLRGSYDVSETILFGSRARRQQGGQRP
jgi:hypothetical protein